MLHLAVLSLQQQLDRTDTRREVASFVRAAS